MVGAPVGIPVSRASNQAYLYVYSRAMVIAPLESTWVRRVPFGARMIARISSVNGKGQME